MTFTVMGIDPGSRLLGYALVTAESHLHRPRILCADTFKVPKCDNFSLKLFAIFSFARELAIKYNPDVVVFEQLLLAKNPRSLILLSQAKASFLCGIFQGYTERKSKLPIIREFTANSIKSQVTGYGHSDKLAVSKTLQWYFGATQFATFDASDAAACALTGFLAHKDLENTSQLDSFAKSKRKSIANSVKLPILSSAKERN